MNKLFEAINSSAKNNLLKIGLHRFRDHKNVLHVLKSIGYKKPFFEDVRQFIRDTVTNNEEAFNSLRDIICIEAIHKGKVWFWNGHGDVCDGQQFHRSEIIYDLGTNIEPFINILKDLNEQQARDELAPAVRFTDDVVSRKTPMIKNILIGIVVLLVLIIGFASNFRLIEVLPDNALVIASDIDGEKVYHSPAVISPECLKTKELSEDVIKAYAEKGLTTVVSAKQAKEEGYKACNLCRNKNGFVGTDVSIVKDKFYKLIGREQTGRWDKEGNWNW
jgi:hypothetical protein